MDIYKKLVNSALNYADNDTIKACAIGENCLAVQSGLGSGLAFVERGFWGIMPSAEEIKAREKEITQMRLDELIAKYIEKDALYAALAFAAINSVFSSLNHSPGEFPLDSTLKKHKSLGMVGCFHPLMASVNQSGIKLELFELQKIPNAHSPKDAPKVMPGCDMLIITGSTFVNKSFHHYLPHINTQADAYIMGPSTPLAPILREDFSLGGSLIQPGSEEEVFAKIRQGYSYRRLQPWLIKVVAKRIPQA